MTLRMPVNHTLQNIRETNAVMEIGDEQVKLQAKISPIM